MSHVTIASIVEGDGEVIALPRLLHRIAGEMAIWDLRVERPWPIGRSKLVKRGELERAVEAVAHRVSGEGGILVLIDADDDCPASLGPELLKRATDARPDKKIAVVLANREYEAWFLASATSLAGECGLPVDLCTQSDPEAVRGAKERLRNLMPAGRRYRETADQAALTSKFDLTMARTNSPSFEKFYRDVARLMGAHGVTVP